MLNKLNTWIYKIKQWICRDSAGSLLQGLGSVLLGIAAGAFTPGTGSQAALAACIMSLSLF